MRSQGHRSSLALSRSIPCLVQNKAATNGAEGLWRRGQVRRNSNQNDSFDCTLNISATCQTSMLHLTSKSAPAPSALVKLGVPVAFTDFTGWEPCTGRPIWNMERFSLKESLLCGCFSCFHFKQQQTCSPTDMATRCLGQRANHSDEHRHSKYGWRSSPRVLWPRRDLGNTAQLETGKIWDSNQSEAASLPLICSFVAGIILAPKKWQHMTTYDNMLEPPSDSSYSCSHYSYHQLPQQHSTTVSTQISSVRSASRHIFWSCFDTSVCRNSFPTSLPKQLQFVAIDINCYSIIIQIMTFCNRPLDSLDQSGSYVSSEILMWF